jgi:hypothetical protein
MAGAAVTSDESIWTLQEGHALHACLPIFFGLPNEPSTWFDVSKFGKVEAVLTQAASDADCALLVEQLRPV